MTTTLIFAAVLVASNVLIGFACFALGMKTGINMQIIMRVVGRETQEQE